MLTLRSMRLLVFVLVLGTLAQGEPWRRHVVDDSSRGADGVRLADVDGDGFQDIATGWEEGGVVRVYLNPGPLRSKRPWPAVTVGEVHSPEDAVFADVDGDNTIDVVSSCEGDEQAVHIHWAPRHTEDNRDGLEWQTTLLDASVGRMRWMYSLPMEVDFRRGLDIVAGGKGPGAQIGWFEAPVDPRQGTEWRWHPISDVGWTMSLISSDMDADGDRDVLVSDRRGRTSGVFWLENPGPGDRLAEAWKRHGIGSPGSEVMFVAEDDLDGDGLEDVIAAVRPRSIVLFRRLDRSGDSWKESQITIPDNAGTSKAVRGGDIDQDGKLDLVFSCEQARGESGGVWWASYDSSSMRDPRFFEISGGTGIKFDLVELVDLDGDEDLDVLTCEESANLGVIWYENPLR